jgi:hypothetical protein
MIRRAILVAAAAVAVILVPSAAMAADYEAAGFTSTVSDTTPAVGQSVTVIIHGGVANANKVITLKIAGVSTQTLTATANAAGAASFTFTLSAAGVYTLTATNASGAVVSTQTITVHAVGAASVAPGKLSSTGFEGTGLAVGGGLLVLTGAGAVLVARRRKTAHVPA